MTEPEDPQHPGPTVALNDPPVTPWSTPAEIQAWIAELRAMRVGGSVRDAITEADRMLAASREYHAKNRKFE